MRLKTLDEFIADRNDPLLRGGARAYIREPGFSSLYVRMGPRTLNGTAHRVVLDLASIEVEEDLRGRGILTALIERLQAVGIIIYVESVVNDRLAAWLPRNGFAVSEIDRSGRSFFRLPPKERRSCG